MSPTLDAAALRRATAATAAAHERVIAHAIAAGRPERAVRAEEERMVEDVYVRDIAEEWGDEGIALFWELWPDARAAARRTEAGAARAARAPQTRLRVTASVAALALIALVAGCWAAFP